jgi:peptidoglycan/xylan/chitin deacetylase (PgdA/CDA1 family)
MKALTLLFHDVVPEGRCDLSGFQSPDADIYKLDCGEFRAHLTAMARAAAAKPGSVSSLPALLITFDDGGVSASLWIADILAELGWPAHFLVASDQIGKPGFLNESQIRALHQGGHVIGSHSCSHPLRMSRCTPDQLAREWRESVEVLSDILGAPVQVASVPGGYYSRRVAAAAAKAGIRFLFNSEPVTSVREVDGCLVLGRFTIQQGVTPEWTAAVVAGAQIPRLRQYLSWNSKKLLKGLGGAHWLRLREYILLRRARRRNP